MRWWVTELALLEETFTTITKMIKRGEDREPLDQINRKIGDHHHPIPQLGAGWRIRGRWFYLSWQSEAKRGEESVCRSITSLWWWRWWWWQSLKGKRLEIVEREAKGRGEGKSNNKVSESFLILLLLLLQLLLLYLFSVAICVNWFHFIRRDFDTEATKRKKL